MSIILVVGLRILAMKTFSFLPAAIEAKFIIYT